VQAVQIILVHRSRQAASQLANAAADANVTPPTHNSSSKEQGGSIAQPRHHVGAQKWRGATFVISLPRGCLLRSAVVIPRLPSRGWSAARSAACGGVRHRF
jgi:hypothetical protein